MDRRKNSRSGGGRRKRSQSKRTRNVRPREVAASAAVGNDDIIAMLREQRARHAAVSAGGEAGAGSGDAVVRDGGGIRADPAREMTVGGRRFQYDAGRNRYFPVSGGRRGGSLSPTPPEDGAGTSPARHDGTCS